MARSEPTERQYEVFLTNDEIIRPDIVKSKDNGWLYCCWTADRPAGESVQSTYPPHAVHHYTSRPVDQDGES